MLISKVYNLSVADLAKVRLFSGKGLEIDSLYIYCSANSTFDLYFTQYQDETTYTYYLYKDEKLYAGNQYNKLLPSYDAAAREWIPETNFNPLKFAFDKNTQLFFELKTTGGVADVIATINKIE